MHVAPLYAFRKFPFWPTGYILLQVMALWGSASGDLLRCSWLLGSSACAWGTELYVFSMQVAVGCWFPAPECTLANSCHSANESCLGMFCRRPSPCSRVHAADSAERAEPNVGACGVAAHCRSDSAGMALRPLPRWAGKLRLLLCTCSCKPLRFGSHGSSNWRMLDFASAR